MIDDFWIYSPTYKRHDNLAKTHLLFKDKFSYVVHEEEYSKYKNLYHSLKVIPKGNISHIAGARNWILENSDYKYIIMADDDISKFTFLKKREREVLSEKKVLETINYMFQITLDMGIGLWGMNLRDDPFAYHVNRPFSFKSPILGPFCGHVIDDLRYDENLTLKEDYDFFLQKMNRYKFCIRANYVSYVCDHEKLAGGCQEYRTTEFEKEQMALFRKKWGSQVVRFNERNPESINARIRL